MNGEDRRVFTQYVLGRLPESEASALERRILGDEETAAAVAEVESDMVDDFVRGHMDAALREAFANRVKEHSHLRERVGFARTLARHLETSGEAPASTHTLRAVPPWWLSVAAVVVLGLWSVTLLQQRGKLQREVADLREQAAAHPAGADEARLRELEAERDRLAASASDSAAERDRIAAELQRKDEELAALRNQRGAPAPAAVQFLLSALVVRGHSDEKVLRIPADAARVDLQVTLDGMPAANAYRVFLRDQGGVELWSGTGLKPQRGNGGVPWLAISMPAGSLRGRGHVQLALEESADGGWLPTATLAIQIAN